MAFKTKKNLSDRAYASLKNMLLRLERFQRVPLSEVKLAATFKMSRTPIREALKKLMAEGLITSYGNKGYVLNVPTVKEIKDIYEVRMMLEGGAVKSAAENIDLDRLEYFEKQFISMKNGLNFKSGEENAAARAADREVANPDRTNGEDDLAKLGEEFHLFLIESSNNEKLAELLTNINSRLKISRMFSYQRRRKEAVEEHLEIISALKGGDGEKSRACMEEHLRSAFRMLTKIM
jgi:DNA-binding GntR family transcriptional regulator